MEVKDTPPEKHKPAQSSKHYLVTERFSVHHHGLSLHFPGTRINVTEQYGATALPRKIMRTPLVRLSENREQGVKGRGQWEEASAPAKMTQRGKSASALGKQGGLSLAPARRWSLLGFGRAPPTTSWAEVSSTSCRAQHTGVLPGEAAGQNMSGAVSPAIFDC